VAIVAALQMAVDAYDDGRLAAAVMRFPRAAPTAGAAVLLRELLAAALAVASARSNALSISSGKNSWTAAILRLLATYDVDLHELFTFPVASAEGACVQTRCGRSSRG